MYSYGPPHMAVQKQDDQHEHDDDDDIVLNLIYIFKKNPTKKN